MERLSQLKEHTERLVTFASKTPRLRERFEMRLKEYEEFWQSLEDLCGQYVQGMWERSGSMYAFIRDVQDAADVVDTVQAVATGVKLARRS